MLDVDWGSANNISGMKASNVLIGSGASACIGSGTVASKVTLTGGAADLESYEYAGLLECQGTIKGLKIGSGAGANYSLYVETFGYVLNGKLDSPDASAASLAMPEAADELAMTDRLNSGRYGATDVLAGAAAASLAEPDGMSGWQGLASLA